MSGFRFAVVADSHIRPADDGPEYPSNSVMVDRNRFVVDLCNLLKPDFVMHLGDIVHPIPSDDGHEAAVRLAAEVYRGLEMSAHHVPGNHDVGDKPDALVAVPPVAEEFYAVFERYWGSPFGSFEHKGCHFVKIDTPVLNSGLEREAEQWEWLEADLAEAAGRVFVFAHYPPFVHHSAEPEHYDNLADPARSRLLALFDRHGVEAFFGGHVHSFFYNRHGDTELYVLPATGFVRPDYSEMAAVAPQDEGGRDDPPKLGVFVVEVGETSHRVRPIRTYGRTPGGSLPADPIAACSPDWSSPVGVTLRHGWASIHDLPTEGLDEFRRKTVRNDYPLLALWEARIHSVRIPIWDIAAPERRERLIALHRGGLRFTVYSGGVPDTSLARAARDLPIERWEVIVPLEQFDSVRDAGGLRPDGVLLAAAPIVGIGGPGHHFVGHGFDPGGDPMLEAWVRTGARVDELVFRVGWDRPVEESVARAAATASRLGIGAVINLQLPRAGESSVFTDDEAVSRRVVEAVAAARAHPDLAVFLDTFMDHDRGYYRRHGLIDRWFNPRPALYELIRAGSG